MSIISDQNTIVLGAILFGLAWLDLWIDAQPIGKTTSRVIWVLLGAKLLRYCNRPALRITRQPSTPAN